MDRERLAEAVQLREMARASQDTVILGEARRLLLDLLAAYPAEAEITYQLAIVHDNLGNGTRVHSFLCPYPQTRSLWS